MMPTVNAVHGTSIHRRIERAHAVGILPLSSDAQAMPKGTDMPTYPRYRAGGWMTIKMWF